MDAGSQNARLPVQVKEPHYLLQPLHPPPSSYGANSGNNVFASFRDWAGNESRYPREVAEAALAHVVGDQTEQAYRRGDALEKRRKLMEEWASYCDGNARRPKTRKRR